MSFDVRREIARISSREVGAVRIPPVSGRYILAVVYKAVMASMVLNPLVVAVTISVVVVVPMTDCTHFALNTTAEIRSLAECTRGGLAPISEGGVWWSRLCWQPP